MEPVHPVQMSIYQSDTHRKDISTMGKDLRGAASEGLTHTFWCDIVIIDEIVFTNFSRIKSDFYQMLKSDF